MSNEAFEKWAIDYGLDYESSFTRDDVEAAWQAAKADSEQEIAELKSHINNLREALQRIKASKTARYEVEADVGGEVFDVLETTPAQSLQAHDNEVIEKCAKVCDAWSLIGKSIAHDVRTLKG